MNGRGPASAGIKDNQAPFACMDIAETAMGIVVQSHASVSSPIDSPFRAESGVHSRGDKQWKCTKRESHRHCLASCLAVCPPDRLLYRHRVKAILVVSSQYSGPSRTSEWSRPALSVRSAESFLSGERFSYPSAQRQNNSPVSTSPRVIPRYLLFYSQHQIDGHSHSTRVLTSRHLLVCTPPRFSLRDGEHDYGGGGDTSSLLES
eukprot:gene29933-37068_t